MEQHPRLQGYIQPAVSATDESAKKPRLLLCVLAHADAETLADLCALLSGVFNDIIIFDGSQDGSFRTQVRCEFGARVARYSCPIRWGSNQYLYHWFIMKELAEEGEKYDYVVFLEGDCFPLGDLRSDLDRMSRNGVDYSAAGLSRVPRCTSWRWGRRIYNQWDFWSETLNSDHLVRIFGMLHIVSGSLIEELHSFVTARKTLDAVGAMRARMGEEWLWVTIADSLGAKLEKHPASEVNALRTTGPVAPLEIYRWQSDSRVTIIHKVRTGAKEPERVAAVLARSGKLTHERACELEDQYRLGVTAPSRLRKLARPVFHYLVDLETKFGVG